jgi:hypothetical protein
MRCRDAGTCSETGDLAIGLPVTMTGSSPMYVLKKSMRLRDLRLVAKEKPAAGKNLLQLAP